MGVKIRNLENESRKIVDRCGKFAVLEHMRDSSVFISNAQIEYFMEQMGVRRRQVVIEMDGSGKIVTQAGAMQWYSGNISSETGVKGAGDFFGKMLNAAVTNESAVKPEYQGNGTLVLEPTYKHIIFQDVSGWGQGGMTIEDGMFLACEGSVKHEVVSRKTLSSAIAGGEGLYNLSLSGNGVVALESNVPFEELVEIELNDDVVKIDGSLAVCWSTSLDFTVERSSKSLLGSVMNGEGLVNVYRGTGKILMCAVAPTETFIEAAKTMESNPTENNIVGTISNLFK